MKQKSTIVFVLLLLTSLLAACAAPAATSNNTVSTAAAPTTVSNTDANPTASSASSNSDADTAIPAATTSDAGTIMDPSLACAGGKTSATQTVQLTEGPYYTPNTPERANLYEEGMIGTRLIVTGYVYDTNCQPVANAWLDFWQADGNGVYDNNGYTLRGHQYTDANGRYELTTVVPGIYPGRTEHIHLKVQAPNGQIITSQLFFPGVAQNESDGIYDPSLLLVIQETSDGLSGQYNFVVPEQ